MAPRSAAHAGERRQARPDAAGRPALAEDSWPALPFRSDAAGGGGRNGPVKAVELKLQFSAPRWSSLVEAEAADEEAADIADSGKAADCETVVRPRAPASNVPSTVPSEVEAPARSLTLASPAAAVSEMTSSGSVSASSETPADDETSEIAFGEFKCGLTEEDASYETGDDEDTWKELASPSKSARRRMRRRRRRDTVKEATPMGGTAHLEAIAALEQPMRTSRSIVTLNDLGLGLGLELPAARPSHGASSQQSKVTAGSARPLPGGDASARQRATGLSSQDQAAILCTASPCGTPLRMQHFGGYMMADPYALGAVSPVTAHAGQLPAEWYCGATVLLGVSYGQQVPQEPEELAAQLRAAAQQVYED